MGRVTWVLLEEPILSRLLQLKQSTIWLSYHHELRSNQVITIYEASRKEINFNMQLLSTAAKICAIG